MVDCIDIEKDSFLIFIVLIILFIIIYIAITKYNYKCSMNKPTTAIVVNEPSNEDTNKTNETSNNE